MADSHWVLSCFPTTKPIGNCCLDLRNGERHPASCAFLAFDGAGALAGVVTLDGEHCSVHPWPSIRQIMLCKTTPAEQDAKPEECWFDEDMQDLDGDLLHDALAVLPWLREDPL